MKNGKGKMQIYAGARKGAQGEGRVSVTVLRSGCGGNVTVLCYAHEEEMVTIHE